MYRYVWLLLLMMGVVPETSQAAEHFITQVTLPSKALVVIAEGEQEPRSIGSYSVRLYSGENPDFPFDDFLDGLIEKREGSIEDVRLIDINGNHRPEVVVILRSTGSGGYLSAQAFLVQDKVLRLLATITNQPKETDPIKALQAQLH